MHPKSFLTACRCVRSASLRLNNGSESGSGAKVHFKHQGPGDAASSQFDRHKDSKRPLSALAGEDGDMHAACLCLPTRLGCKSCSAFFNPRHLNTETVANPAATFFPNPDKLKH
jgi:hypothetical protein